MWLLAHGLTERFDILGAFEPVDHAVAVRAEHSEVVTWI
jgi:hypothetical protein